MAEQNLTLTNASKFITFPTMDVMGFPIYGGPLLERQVWTYIACVMKKNLV